MSYPDPYTFYTRHFLRKIVLNPKHYLHIKNLFLGYLPEESFLYFILCVVLIDLHFRYFNVWNCNTWRFQQGSCKRYIHTCLKEVHESSVVDLDPVGSALFCQIRIRIVTEKTNQERIRGSIKGCQNKKHF